MKKRFTRFLLAAVMLLSAFGALTTVGFADLDNYGIVRDYADVFTEDEEQALVELLDEAAAKTGCNISVVAEDNIGSQTSKEYAGEALTSSFGSDSSSILLLISNDFENSNNYDWVELSGKAADEYYGKINDMLDCFYSGLDSGGYYQGVVSFCGYFDVQTDVPTESFKVNLADYDDLIPAEQQIQLVEIMQSCADEIECNVGVVITDDLQGYSDEGYSIEFMESSFGKGSNSIVLLYNNDRSNMSYVDWIYTYGLATELYDHQVDAIFDYMYAGFDSNGGNNYYDGIRYFCSYLEGHKDGGIYNDYNNYYDDENYYYEDSGNVFGAVLIPIAFAGVVTFVITSVFVSGYKKKAPVSAKNYMDTSRTKYTRRDDLYLRETTTHVRISSSSSGGGGSRGGGGRSRSGGGGGGGRRR